MDASAYFALLNASDSSHSAALTILRRLIEARWELFTTSLIVAETHALILNRLGRDRARQFLDDMDGGNTTVVWISRNDAERAKGIIRQHQDESYSLSDAATFVVMERREYRLPSRSIADFRNTEFSCWGRKGPVTGRP